MFRETSEHIGFRELTRSADGSLRSRRLGLGIGPGAGPRRAIASVVGFMDLIVDIDQVIEEILGALAHVLARIERVLTTWTGGEAIDHRGSTTSNVFADVLIG